MLICLHFLNEENTTYKMHEKATDDINLFAALLKKKSLGDTLEAIIPWCDVTKGTGNPPG